MSQNVQLISKPLSTFISSYECAKLVYEVNNIVTSIGSLFEVSCCLNQVPQDGWTIGFGDVIFTFSNTANNDPQIILIDTISNMVQEMFDYISNSYSFSSDYEIFKEGNCIRFLAKKNGTLLQFNSNGLNIDNTVDPSLSVDILDCTIIQSGTDFDLLDKYKLIGVLEIFDGRNWCRIDEFVKDAIPDILDKACTTFETKVDFDLSACAKLNGSSKKVDICNHASFSNDDYIKKYRFRVADVYGENPQPRQFCSTEEFDFISSAITDLTPYYLGTCQEEGLIKQLDFCPSEIEVCPNTPLFANVIINNDRQWSLVSNILVEYDDGTSESMINDIINGFGQTMITIPYGPNQISQPLNDDCIVYETKFQCVGCWKIIEQGVLISGQTMCFNLPEAIAANQGSYPAELCSLNLRQGCIYELSFNVLDFNIVGSPNDVELFLVQNTDTLPVNGINLGTINANGSYTLSIDLSGEIFNFHCLKFLIVNNYDDDGNATDYVEFCISDFNIIKQDVCKNIVCYTHLIRLTDSFSGEDTFYETKKVCLTECCDTCSFVFLNSLNTYSTITFNCPKSESINLSFDTALFCDCDESGGQVTLGGDASLLETAILTIENNQSELFKEFLKSIERYKIEGCEMIKVNGIQGQFQYNNLDDKNSKTVIEISYELDKNCPVLQY